MKKVIDGITGLLILVLVILIAVFKDNLSIVALCTGIIGTIIGICLMIKKSEHGILMLSITISLLIGTILYLTDLFVYEDSLTFTISSSVLLLTLLSLIRDGLIKKAMMLKFDTLVKGIVIDLIPNKNVSKECYIPLYEYEINGLKYEIEYYKSLDKNIPDIGDEISFRIDSNEPTEVYFIKSFIEEFKFKIVGIVTIIVCLLILVSLF